MQSNLGKKYQILVTNNLIISIYNFELFQRFSGETKDKEVMQGKFGHVKRNFNRQYSIEIEEETQETRSAYLKNKILISKKAHDLL